MNTDTTLDGPEPVKLNPFNPSSEAVATREMSQMDVAMTRAAQEVQAAMVIAKKFPRDEAKAFHRITQACKRLKLAEDAEYAFARGGTTVRGPSIRFAEMLCSNWGNIDTGTIELERKEGESIMMAYAWDLETNARSTKVFTVAHIRDKRGGGVALDNQRDIYEMTANQGARRLRACILALIPGDVVESALEQCDKTLKEKQDSPLIDRVRAMATNFDELGVTPEMIEKRLGHRLDTTSETELVGLRRIFKSIRDNMAGKEQFFDVPAAGATPAQKPIIGAKPKAPKQETKPAEATATPAASKTTAPVSDIPAVTAEELATCVDQPTSLALMGKLCERDGVSLPQVHKLAQQRNLAGKKTEEAMQMSETNLKLILGVWSTWVPDLRKVTV